MATVDNPGPGTLILAIETAGRGGSLALADDNGILSYTPFTGQLRHSAQLFWSLRDMLGQLGARPAQIGQVYASVGPGSFTGIRMGVTIAKTLHLALGCRVVSVDTLDVIAANVPPELIAEGTLITVVDAKRNLFYIATYESGLAQGPQGTAVPGLVKTGCDTVATSCQILDMTRAGCRPVLLAGEGLLYHIERFQAPGVRILDQRYWSPTAVNVYRLGRSKALAGLYEDPLRMAPRYIVPPQITKSSK